MSPKSIFIFINIICLLGFYKNRKGNFKIKKKKTLYFCSKEENQRDCAVHINLNQIAEALKKKKNYVVKKKIKEIV